MYSPTTRLLTVLELLQSHKQMSGSELARRLEVNVRTIRRYIVDLQAMGIPVETERGPYGSYQLQRGYKLPPLMYNDAEAIALTLGLLVIREFNFPVDPTGLEGALAKTERVMPEKLLRQVRGLQDGIIFNVNTPPALRQNSFVVTLSSAAHQRQRVFLSYLAWNGEESERDFDPYGLVFNEGYWYTAGYCHLRHDLRTFRLDRIVKLATTEQTFERPDDFDVLSHVVTSIASMPGTEQIEVLLKTSLEHAQEIISPILGTLEVTPEGILLRRSASQLEWIAHILLSVDFPVQIRKSAALKALIKQLADRALKILNDEEKS
jgi:predicted DNA-binding transcriptional regulator YafY